jgi:hypothetical protein
MLLESRVIMRGVLVLLVSSLFLLGSSQIGHDVPLRLQEVAQTMKIKPTLYVVHHSGRVGRMLSPSQVEQNMRQWMNELSLDKQQTHRDQDGIRYEATGMWGNLDVSLSMIIDEPKATQSDPYLAIQVTGKGMPTVAWSQAADNIHKFLHEQRIPTHFHYSIQGTLDRVTDTSAIAHHIIKQLHAKEIEGIQTDQTVSLSAYSPLFSEQIQTMGGAMNLQVATHRNQTDGKLIVTIGSPIITVEY